MKRKTVFLVAAVLLGFAVSSDAQIQQDTVNGWHLTLATTGVSKFFMQLITGTSNGAYVGTSQLFGMAMLPYTEEVRVVKNLGRELDVPAKIKFAVRLKKLVPDTTNLSFDFFVSHKDTIQWFNGVNLNGGGGVDWFDYFSANPVRPVLIQKVDAIGIRFLVIGKKADPGEVMFDNIEFVYADGSTIFIDNFEQSAAKPTLQFPTNVWDFGKVAIGDSAVAFIQGKNIGADTARIYSVTSSVPWLIPYPTGSLTLPPDAISYWKVTYKPQLGMTAGRWAVVFQSNGVTSPDSVFATGDVTTGIHEISGNTPGKYSLGQNYPNPFNPSTKIRIEVPKSGLVKLTVYNILGQLVATLVNKSLSAGTYEYEFTPAEIGNLASGVYIYRITAEGFTAVKKMTLLK